MTERQPSPADTSELCAQTSDGSRSVPELGPDTVISSETVISPDTLMPEVTPDATPDTLLSSYDYPLPERFIAQAAVVPRDCSRLLVVGAQTHQHQLFYQLPEILRSGDLLVMNNTQVIPARLLGQKLSPGRGHASVAHGSSGESAKDASCGEATGNVTEVTADINADLQSADIKSADVKSLDIEVLLLERYTQRQWLALVRPGRRLKPGSQVIFGDLKATILETDLATRGRLIEFDLPEGEDLLTRLNDVGQLPLPPYIKSFDGVNVAEQYQTVYAERPGAVAAPTAGLHFTPELLTQLQQQHIDHCFLTLHVGVGTFRPVEVENIHDHHMHQEWLEIPAATVAKIQQTQAQGGRVIAVGTTVVRALEGAAQSGQLSPFSGKTDIFIHPGYQWRVVQGLITNFHLPRSSLLMLVSALIGRERLLNLYQAAMAAQYRFYSFGDAMLILPEAVTEQASSSR
jgi:S-adenosylmethionine:tRNA ribosyltransferase-isomerase